MALVLAFLSRPRRARFLSNDAAAALFLRCCLNLSRAASRSLPGRRWISNPGPLRRGHDVGQATLWKRRFRFCRRDVFGTRVYPGGREIVRSTPLGLEVMLRLDLRFITAMCAKIPGFYKRDVFKRSLPAIRPHAAAIAAALRRYKARRVKRGLAHLVPTAARWPGFEIRHLPGKDREAALDKLRRQREKRAAAAALLKKRARERKARTSAMLYWGYLVLVSVLTLMVVFL